jgi:hypothetical protein
MQAGNALRDGILLPRHTQNPTSRKNFFPSNHDPKSIRLEYPLLMVDIPCHWWFTRHALINSEMATKIEGGR